MSLDIKRAISDAKNKIDILEEKIIKMYQNLRDKRDNIVKMQRTIDRYEKYFLFIENEMKRAKKLLNKNKKGEKRGEKKSADDMDDMMNEVVEKFLHNDGIDEDFFENFKKLKEALEETRKIFSEGVAFFNKVKSEVKSMNDEANEVQFLYLQQIQKYKAKLQGISSEMKNIEASIPSNIMRVFKKMLIATNGDALAIYDKANNQCKSCKANISEDFFQKADSDGNLFFCPNCGRILILE